MSDLREHIETIEAGYEFLLAYAAQGRIDEDRSHPGPYASDTLEAMQAALGGLKSALDPNADPFHAVLHDDIDKARALIGFVLNSPPLSSEAVDNLNVSIHLRTVLTDAFVLSGRLGNEDDG